MTNSPLMQLLEFSPDDLALNREGKLSENQHYRLRLRRRRTELTGLFTVLIAAFIATAFIFIGNRNNSPILIFVGIGITLVSAYLSGTFLRHWLRLNSDINGGKVIITSGKLERVLKPLNRRVIHYIIRVGQVELAVSKEEFTTFEHEASYHLYRAPYSGTLLAAERTSSE